MKLDEVAARARLGDADHGVLCTVHPERGVDPVPVAFAVEGELVGVPVDRIKSKSSTRLQRQRNLEMDPRAALLVERWDRDDWSKLWWVRVGLRWQSTPSPTETTALSTLLAARYPQYLDQPFDRILLFEVRSVTGWAATA